MKHFFLLGVFSLLSLMLRAQVSDLYLPLNQKGRIEIPFDYENNFIVLNVVFDKVFPLRFILDTGAEHTILTNRAITDLLAIEYRRTFTIMGADMKTKLFAYLVRGISLDIQDLSFRNRSILVLEEDYFQFDQFAGINVQGIIGADILRRFVVEINFRKETVTFIDPRYFKPVANRYRTIPVEFNRGKPYLFTSVTLANQKTISTKLLMDTGASLGLLLYTNSDSLLKLPERIIPSSLALGLGGSLDGYMGRVHQFQLDGSYGFRELVTNFQQLTPLADSSYMNNRNGIIGNRVLEHFNVVVDYVREEVYLRQIKDFDDRTEYDKSGLFLRAFGKNLNQFEVFYVLPGSPAAQAGLQSDDELVRINWLPTSFFTLEGITKKLSRKAGKKIRLVIRRNGEKIRFTFELRDLL